MSRYFTRPRALVRGFDIDDDTPLLPNLSVPEHEERFTGLIDQFGNDICRYPRPVGFGRDEEWS